MATNNVHIPDDLLAQAEKVASRQGRTADDLAADALKRYLAHEKLEQLSRYGQHKARELGVENLSSEEQREYVNRAIRQIRIERQG